MPETYAVALLHFNLQYCAGGLEGLWDDWPTDEESVEDAIIIESFAPILDLLDRHPTWALDLEMQGYMVDVLAERHPDVLDHLRTLAQAGSVELVSVHWSDQLWVAYPRRDMEVSIELTKQSFADAGLPLSDVVWSQEGQLGEGMLRLMPEHDYRVAILPQNLAGYLWEGGAPESLYTYGDVLVLPTGGHTTPDGEARVEWTFANDGELLATGDMNCYLGAAFVEDPDAIAAYEQELLDLEASGATIGTISQWADVAAAHGTTPLPPLLDGTWQPDDTGNVYRWMGGFGLWGNDERDNEVRTAVQRARNAVVAAENAGGDVDEAWKEVLLAEVSDSTGWNPYPTEVRYALEHAAAALSLAEEAACGAGVGTATPTPYEAIDEPDDVPSFEFDGREVVASWSSSEEGVFAVELAFGTGGDPPRVSFAWDALDYATVPALTEEVVRVPVDEIAADPISLPLSLGLAHLYDDWWLVEDTETVMLAGTFSRDVATLAFEDDTWPSAEGGTWRFLFLRGTDEDAAEIAHNTNALRPVVFECPETGAGDTEDLRRCGCGTGPRASGWIAGMVAMLYRRRALRGLS